MHRLVMILALAVMASREAYAQSLRDKLSGLFIFGDGEDPLFLGGTGDPNNPDAVRIHGNHFVPAAVASNGTVISFLTNSIGSNVANVPVSATSGGSTFSFEGGVPVRTSTSAGPIFGERAQTLGRGRMLAGLARTGANFKTLRGVDLDNLRFTFTHANSDFEGCDSIAGGDCSLLGVPDARERDHRPRPRRSTSGSPSRRSCSPTGSPTGWTWASASRSCRPRSRAPATRRSIRSARRPRCTSSAARRRSRAHRLALRATDRPRAWATSTPGSR